MAINKNIDVNKKTVDGNIDLGFSTNKKRFSVGGDTSKIIEFDPSDIGVANRLSKSMSRFKALDTQWQQLNESATKVSEGNTDDLDATIDDTKDFSEKFDKLENEIKDIINYVFDGDVADKLLGNSSAFSPVNGFFKYEHIITAVLNCYEQNIKDESPKFNSRKVNTYTHKYIKK